jgi:wyosine [tRNA(Phe)-imidazoG37] synthetase (radical SAM superfamily)
LGVDLLSTQGKTCNFDCVYCQLGRTANPVAERSEFVPIAELTRELETVKGVAADFVTFSGMGEPTLASNLGQAIESARAILHLPVAVLTNSSLTSMEEVRDDLAKADVVVAKMDAHNQETFDQVNRPTIDLLFSGILEGLEVFRARFKGKLCLQIMFIGKNKNSATDIGKVAKSLLPHEIQLNTPLRPCAVKPLSPSQMSSVRTRFGDPGNVITVYEASRPAVSPLDSHNTLRRRPNR